MAELTEAEQQAFENALEFQSMTVSPNSRSKTNLSPKEIVEAVQMKQRLSKPSHRKKFRIV